MEGLTDLAARINAALPQTQCTRCGFPDCASYAQAIAAGEAAINQCPPGGEQGIARLAAISGHAIQPLSPRHGMEGPRSVAFVDEDWCIGCTLCLKACPTDAILGSNKRMHTIMESYCTGCELCLPVCPVDCILLENASGNATGWQAWSPMQAAQASKRYEQHRQRASLNAGQGVNPPATPVEKAADAPTTAIPVDPKRATITAALERARALRKR